MLKPGEEEGRGKPSYGWWRFSGQNLVSGPGGGTEPGNSSVAREGDIDNITQYIEGKAQKATL